VVIWECKDTQGAEICKKIVCHCERSAAIAPER